MNRGSTIVSLLLKAYENEVCLDRHAKQDLGIELPSNFPLYKVMKIQALSRRYGRLFDVFVALYPFAFYVFGLIYPLLFLFYALSISVTSVGKGRDNTGRSSRAFLLSASESRRLYKSFDCKEEEFLYYKKMSSLVERLTFKECWQAALIGWQYFFGLFGVDRPERKNLLFHSIDFMHLICLVLNLEKKGFGEEGVYYDDHYQRWGFLISHLSQKMIIVQHGFIAADINFKFDYGRVSRVYVFDDLFKPIFSSYYQVENFEYQVNSLDLSECHADGVAVFLASSAPHLGAEITFAETIKTLDGCSLVLKLHPVHEYPQEVDKLLKLADLVVEGSKFPDCDFMVSYNSFLGYEYQSIGKKVFFLEQDNIEDIIGEVGEVSRGLPDM